MMTPIKTAEGAVGYAESFLKKYYAFSRLEKVTQEDDGAWTVEFDVSILGPPEIIRMKVDEVSGEIIEYTKV